MPRPQADQSLEVLEVGPRGSEALQEIPRRPSHLCCSFCWPPSHSLQQFQLTSPSLQHVVHCPLGHWILLMEQHHEHPSRQGWHSAHKANSVICWVHKTTRELQPSGHFNLVCLISQQNTTSLSSCSQSVVVAPTGAVRTATHRGQRPEQISLVLPLVFQWWHTCKQPVVGARIHFLNSSEHHEEKRFKENCPINSVSYCKYPCIVQTIFAVR
jgi:hypothetical protein